METYYAIFGTRSDKKEVSAMVRSTTKTKADPTFLILVQLGGIGVTQEDSNAKICFSDLFHRNFR